MSGDWLHWQSKVSSVSISCPRRRPFALPIIERKLRELGAGPNAELHTNDGTHKLGSAA
jgi:hypothetical protein